MKTLFFVLVFGVVHFSMSSNNISVFETKEDKHTSSFKVKGACGMCKSRIETAANEAGATEAYWDAEKQLLTVSYNPDDTSEDKVHKSVAVSGHDTSKVRADDEVYNGLHACCKYQRIEKQNYE